MSQQHVMVVSGASRQAAYLEREPKVMFQVKDRLSDEFDESPHYEPLTLSPFPQRLYGLLDVSSIFWFYYSNLSPFQGAAFPHRMHLMG